MSVNIGVLEVNMQEKKEDMIWFLLFVFSLFNINLQTCDDETLLTHLA